MRVAAPLNHPAKSGGLKGGELPSLHLATERIANPFLDQVLACPDVEEYARQRINLIREFGFIPPTEEALRAIASHCPRVVELGAGKGYWAKQLASYGVNIIAFDINVPQKPHYPVLYGTEHSIVPHCDDRALLLCWPDWADCMAANALEIYIEGGGKKVIYVGESGTGCTADEKFRRSLDKNFVQICSFDLPVPWPMVTMTIWSRVEDRRQEVV